MPADPNRVPADGVRPYPSTMPAQPLLVVEPTKKLAEMTPAERRALAELLARAAIEASASAR